MMERAPHYDTPLGPPLRATCPKRLYRRLRSAERLARRGPASAYLAKQKRIHALAEALGVVGDLERIYTAAAEG